MKRHLLLAISVLALTAVSQPIFAAEVETPAAAPAPERAPAAERERAARPARERAPVQRQAAAQSSPSSSFTGNQVSGFGGGNTGGGGFADPSFCGTSPGFSPSCGLTVWDIGRATGFIGGAEYSQHFALGPNWLWGWAADVSGSTLKASSTQTTTRCATPGCTPINETVSISQSQSFLSTWRLTAGFVPAGLWNTMIFATAGGAVGTVSGDFSFAAADATHTTFGYGTGSYNLVRFGYTAGGGVSFKYPVFGIQGARVTLEYLYTNLGTVTQNYPLVATGACGPCTPGIAQTSMKTDTSTLRLKVGVPL
jgi:hypothetical protein